MTATETNAERPNDADDYLFDLRGYLLVENALSSDEVDALNDAADEILPLAPGEWDGHVHRLESNSGDAPELQQIYEAPPFETLIDHPAWIEYVKRYVGGEGTFDYNHGPLFIDENFFQLFPEGKGTPLHSGGHDRVKRTQFRYHDDEFRCGQINILIALNDIGPGDGATMVVPGSHKSNFEPPYFEEYRGQTLEDVPEAREVHMGAGDALLFVDSLTHGSATRINSGERRIAVFRYGPSWGVSRRGYEPSQELLDRLSSDQRDLVRTFGSVERRVPPSA